MDETVPESMSNSENAPVAYYGDNSNGATAGLLGALALAKPESYDGVGMIGAYNGSSLRHEVGELKGEIKDSECAVRHDILETSADIRRELAKEGQDIRRDIASEGYQTRTAVHASESNLMNRLCEVEKQGIRAEYEAKLTAEKVIKEVNTAAQHNAERTQDKLAHGFEENEEKLDALSEQVSKGFSHAREESLEEKVDSLREKLQTAELSRLICCGCSSGPGNSGK